MRIISFIAVFVCLGLSGMAEPEKWMDEFPAYPGAHQLGTQCLMGLAHGGVE